MDHMLECKEAKQIIKGISGNKALTIENKEELMTIYDYMEIILKTLIKRRKFSLHSEKSDVLN